MTQALINTRDGIVGYWTYPPPAPPGQLAFDNPGNLIRWEAAIRASLYDFELVSRLGFSTDVVAGVDTAYLWSSQPAPAGGAYNPLVTMIAPTIDQFRDLLVFVDRYADLRADRAAEILSQEGGAVAFFGSIPFLHPERTRWTLELLAAAVRLALFAEMRFKHALACRRPNEYSPQVQPMILTPGHGSLPMGHGAETFIMAFVLWQLLTRSGVNPYTDVGWGVQMFRLAARVAMNRIVAGVHFTVDAAAGELLGLTLGQYFLARCGVTPSYTPWTFDGTQFPDPTGGAAPPNDGDFYWNALFDFAAPGQTATAYANPGGAAVNVNASGILQWLWGQAAGEWP